MSLYIQTGSVMKLKFYETNEFKKQEAMWEFRLVVSGFKDHEKTIGKERVLKQNAANSYRQALALNRIAKEEYFNAISANTTNTSFHKETDRLVMTNFANGLSIKQITDEFKALGKSIDRHTVTFIIRRYEHVWGIRKWTAKERNLKHG